MINYWSIPSVGAAFVCCPSSASRCPLAKFSNLWLWWARSWSAVGSCSFILLLILRPGHAQFAGVYLCIYVSNKATAILGHGFHLTRVGHGVQSHRSCNPRLPEIRPDILYYMISHPPEPIFSVWVGSPFRAVSFPPPRQLLNPLACLVSLHLSATHFS